MAFKSSAECEALSKSATALICSGRVLDHAVCVAGLELLGFVVMPSLASSEALALSVSGEAPKSIAVCLACGSVAWAAGPWYSGCSQRMVPVASSAARRVFRSTRRCSRASVQAALADFFVAHVLQLDLVAERIRKRDVVAAGAAEFRKQQYDLAHVNHHDDGRPAFGGGQCAGVVLRLGVRAQQGVAVVFGVAAGGDFFDFEDEVAAFLAVHEPV